MALASALWPAEEAIRQDFHAAVSLCNVESLVSAPAQAALTERTAQREQPAQLNRADALHASKFQVLEWLVSARPVAAVVATLVQVFQANPTAVRPERPVPRRPLRCGGRIIFSGTSEKPSFEHVAAN